MMYQFQKDLPKIPLPELEETCERYLQTVASLLSQTELTQTRTVVRDFQQGSGLKLQRQLNMIVRSTNSRYLYKLLEESYLENRLPLTITTNYAGVLSPILATSKTPLATIATWIYQTLKFYLKVKHRQLKPDKDIFQKSSRPLCMIQYDNLFGTSRIAGIKKDGWLGASEPEHIVVIRRNAFYSVKLIEGGLATAVEIEQQLNWILENTPLDEPAVGALTTLNRTQWAVLRSHIAAVTSDNAYSLALLDNALFVVCLDETIPTNLEAASRNALHGDGRNRWFDKPLQLIFTHFGQAAVNIEHTGLDGYTIMRFLSEVYQNCQHNSEPSALTTPVKFQPPTRLRWSLTQEILEEIEQAQLAVDNLIAQNETRVLEFKEFGQDFIKQHGFSPDAVIQLAIQLAYTRLHGEIVCISESVHTRAFQYGRWEDVRVVTTESIEFIRAFTEPNPDETQYSDLKLAVDAHVMLQLTCKKGLGIERHLEALYSLARSQGVIPDIFQDKAYMEVFCQPVVSTSGLLSGMGLVLFCFGPVVSHGYGVGYLSGSNGFTFNVTSQYRQTGKFIELLEQCLLELGKIIKINWEK